VCAPFNSLLARSRRADCLPSCSPPVPISRSQPSLHACSTASPPIFLDFSRFVVPPSQRNATHPQRKAKQRNATYPKLVFCLIFIHPFIVKFSPSCRSRRLRVWTHFSSTCLFFHVSFSYCLESSCFPVSPADSARFCEVYLSGIIFQSTKLPPLF